MLKNNTKESLAMHDSNPSAEYAFAAMYCSAAGGLQLLTATTRPSIPWRFLALYFVLTSHSIPLVCMLPI